MYISFGKNSYETCYVLYFPNLTDSTEIMRVARQMLTYGRSYYYYMYVVNRRCIQTYKPKWQWR